MHSEHTRYFRLYPRPKFLLITPDHKKKLTRQFNKIWDDIKQEWIVPRRITEEGSLSPNSRMKLKSAIRWLAASARWKKCYSKSRKRMVPYKINQVLLTFSENMQDDNKARMILSEWIEMCKYRFDLKNYTWKAEPQERGAIHFHMATDTYMPFREVNYTWNRSLVKHGLSPITNAGTTAEPVIGIDNYESYLADYFMNDEKHEGRRKIKGKLWGCSHALSQAGKEFLLIDESEANEMQATDWQNSLYKKLQDKGDPIPDFLKFNDIYLIDEKYYKKLPDCNLKTLWNFQLSQLNPSTGNKTFW